MRNLIFGLTCLLVVAEPLLARPMRPRDVDQLPSVEPTATLSYGPDPQQVRQWTEVEALILRAFR